MAEIILELKNVQAFYKEGRRKKQILKDVSFQIMEKEIVGLLGPSGSGKTTLCKCILGLLDDYSGEIIHANENPQMIFQDPYGSLNPKKTIGWILEEPLKVKGGYSKKEREAQVEKMLEKVKLSSDFAARFPRELSGGQRQRISLALAILTGSKLILADEPLSALDVTVQAQIIELLIELKEKEGLSYLFVSHDLDVVSQLAQRVLVIESGTIQEYSL